MTHGDRKSKEYASWTDMLTRCRNPNSTAYARYGGRGIKVCDRWLNYENFLADMGRRPSGQHQLEREDNEKGYGPDNCRWATRTEQANNRRSNVLVEYHGQTKTVAQWATELGFGKMSFWRRLFRHKWDKERAFTQPMRKGAVTQPTEADWAAHQTECDKRAETTNR